jgi:hypothetical protein
MAVQPSSVGASSVICSNIDFPAGGKGVAGGDRQTILTNSEFSSRCDRRLSRGGSGDADRFLLFMSRDLRKQQAGVE